MFELINKVEISVTPATWHTHGLTLATREECLGELLAGAILASILYSLWQDLSDPYSSKHCACAYTFELENKNWLLPSLTRTSNKCLKWSSWNTCMKYLSTCALRRIHSIRLSSTQQSHENKTCQKLLWDCPGRNSGSGGPGPDRHHPAAAAVKSFKSCHVESINFLPLSQLGKHFNNKIWECIQNAERRTEFIKENSTLLAQCLQTTLTKIND